LAFYYPGTVLSSISTGTTTGSTTTTAPKVVNDVKAYAYATTDVNVRAGAGTNTAVLGTLKKGTKVTVLKAFENSSWHKISYDGKQAYVQVNYLSLVNGF